MDNQNQNENIKIEKPKFDRKKYMKDYMNEYFKKHKVECKTCNCMIFPHSIKQHNESMKHKYLALSKEV